MAKHMRRLGRHSRERGMAIIFYATMLFFVIGCVGLAVDVGTIYMIKARLSAAADAAALAAGRSVNLALTLGQAQSNAISTANQFFTANFPNGYFNTLGSPTVTPLLTQETDGNGNPNGVLDIQVSASVRAPTYFMNIFNVSNISVGANGTASRRGLVLMMVLDISSSMGNGAGSSCAANPERGASPFGACACRVEGFLQPLQAGSVEQHCAPPARTGSAQIDAGDAALGDWLPLG